MLSCVCPKGDPLEQLSISFREAVRNVTILVFSNMVAICFYTPDSYGELKKVADDNKNLCDTYADWLVEFSKAVKGLREQGLKFETVNINIVELQKWCKQNKLKNTSSSRSKYVAEISNAEFPDSG